jgi:hypothetical protein
VAPKTPKYRPFTPAQQRRNAAFLAALRRTGNVRLACRDLGVNRSTFTKRRARCPAFAAAWDSALSAAHAAFLRAGGERMPGAGKGTGTRTCPHSDARPPDLRTRGGEPAIVRLPDGRLQLRHAPPGRMTDAARRRILATVEETNNLRLAARAAGFAHTSLFARARAHPDFGRALDLTRRIGRDRVIWQGMEAARTAAATWRCDFDVPIAPIAAERALIQLVYHWRDGRFQDEARRRRPPTPFSQLQPRIVAKLNAWRRAEWHRETGRWRYPDEDGEE